MPLYLDKKVFGKLYEVEAEWGITMVRAKSCRFKILFRNHYRAASFCLNLANLYFYSAAMEQHRITCEEEGRYVGKWCINFSHCDRLLRKFSSVVLFARIFALMPNSDYLFCVTFRGWDGEE